MIILWVIQVLVYSNIMVVLSWTHPYHSTLSNLRKLFHRNYLFTFCKYIHYSSSVSSSNIAHSNKISLVSAVSKRMSGNTRLYTLKREFSEESHVDRLDSINLNKEKEWEDILRSELSKHQQKGDKGAITRRITELYIPIYKYLSRSLPSKRIASNSASSMNDEKKSPLLVGISAPQV